MTARCLLPLALLCTNLLGQETQPASQPLPPTSPPPHGLRTLQDPDLPTTGDGEWSYHGVTPTTPRGAVGDGQGPRDSGPERTFLLYQPKSYKPGQPCVLLIHGGGGSAHKLARQQGGNRHWQVLSDREGFLLLLPDGTKRQRFGDRRQWNDIRPVGSTADDVGFLDAVLDTAIQTHGADPDRVYVTGSSNGGMMTFRVVMERAERFAAAAAFIATHPVDQSLMRKPSRPIPMLMCNGTEDSLIQWNGGPIRGRNGIMGPVMECAAWWAAANGCSTEPTVERLEDLDPDDGTTIDRLIYPTQQENGQVGTPFELLRVNGGGHSMPSVAHLRTKRPILDRILGVASKDLEGAEYAWHWMRRFKRPSDATPEAR